MAVNTRNRRASCVGFASPSRAVYPNPDGLTLSQADRQQAGYSYPGVLVAPPQKAKSGWLADPGIRVWAASAEARVWQALDGGRVWRAGDENVGQLVRNEIVKAPGDRVRLYMDFGDVPEILAGAAVTSCTCAVSPSGPTVPASATVETGGYRVSAKISGGTDATDYVVTFVATLNNADATLISRAASLKVRV